ncbi:hypothetical protein [Rhodococcus ruber]
MSEQTYFRWRSQFGSLGGRVCEVSEGLELENARIERLLVRPS